MPTSDWAPAVADVAAVLRSRTKDRNGTEVGTFNADTRPTNGQVTAEIELAVGDVVSVFSEELPEVTWPQAKRVVALGTAMLVELSYFPEQVASGKSPYEQLKALYDAAWKRFEVSFNQADDSGVGAGDGDVGAYGNPSYAFPEDQGGLVGWATRF